MPMITKRFIAVVCTGDISGEHTTQDTDIVVLDGHIMATKFVTSVSTLSRCSKKIKGSIYGNLFLSQVMNHPFNE